MKRTISHQIFFVITLTTTIIFTLFLGYVKFVVEPVSIQSSKAEAASLAQGKALEIEMWIDAKANEFRSLSQVPAFKSIDLRGIEPLIENLTQSYKENDQIMERFAYGGVNAYSGFNWVNADAILDLINYEDYQRIVEQNEEYGMSDPVYTKDHEEMILFYFPIKGYSGENDGLFCSAIPMTRINELVNTGNINHGKSWIMDKDAHIFTSDEIYFTQKYMDVREIVDQFNTSKSGSIEVINQTGNRCTLFYSFIENSEDWFHCTLIDNRQFSQNISEMMTGLWLIYSLLLITTLVSAKMLSKSIVTPIELLQEKMKMVEEGNLKAFYENTTIDEVDELGKSYNHMLEEINSLIVQKEVEEQKKRQAELSVLQSQIKPHFLYNTLDNIRWMAVEEGSSKIAKMVSSLSTFFRVILSNGEEYIPLETEVKHTLAYLEIQQMRYPNLFDYQSKVDEEIKSFIVPKILIQPLVENSIYHGIKNADRKCIINILVHKVDDEIQLQVKDNGKGMDTSTLEQLRSYIEKGKDSGHYGLGNIQERLHYAYGERSKIEVDSTLDQGTVVTLYIPVKED